MNVLHCPSIEMRQKVEQRVYVHCKVTHFKDLFEATTRQHIEIMLPHISAYLMQQHHQYIPTATIKVHNIYARSDVYFVDTNKLFSDLYLHTKYYYRINRTCNLNLSSHITSHIKLTIYFYMTL